MTFREAVAQDIHAVFLHPAELAERRTLRYDGAEYLDIPVSIQTLTLESRERLSARGFGRGGTDGAAGLCQVTCVLFCALEDLGGRIPEQGKTLCVNDREGGGGWFRDYTIMTCGCEMGMLEIGLRKVEE